MYLSKVYFVLKKPTNQLYTNMWTPLNGPIRYSFRQTAVNGKSETLYLFTEI